jgi:hypothetical protein
MEHREDHRVADRDLHPEYRSREEAFRERAGALWQREQENRERIRSQVGLSEEERIDRYTQARQSIDREFERLANNFGAEEGQAIAQATKTLYAGEGQGFAQHLAAVAAVPDERLAELLSTAQRSGQESLARAVASVAYERGVRAVFNRWAEANPERAEALERIRRTPGAVQHFDRTVRALTPPRAEMGDLMPRKDDIEKHVQEKAAEEVRRRRALAGHDRQPASSARRGMGVPLPPRR